MAARKPVLRIQTIYNNDDVDSLVEFLEARILELEQELENLEYETLEANERNH